MEILMKQISSLEKIRVDDVLNYDDVSCKTVMQGERLSYQIVINTKDTAEGAKLPTKIWVESELGDAVSIYRVNQVFVDKPSTEDVTGEGYLLEKPGFLPDVLVPLDEQNGLVSLALPNVNLWVKIDIPRDAQPGKYTIKVNCGVFVQHGGDNPITDTASSEFVVDVIPAVIPEQNLIYTRWFYADCISDFHNVPVYSEEHWALIDKYIAAAVDVGVNMILVPIHTPPLDTAVGARRPCVQLVDIEKKGDTYEFGFEKFHRFISICKKNGVKYYEMAHLFSQWGAEFAPNIMVTENGKTDYMFGWHVKADSEEYRGFIKQYIKAISAELVKEKISANTYFHVSDEPNTNNLEKYEIARNIIKPLIGDSKTFDALSHVEFYENGLVECPVTSIKALDVFLPHNIENQWTYYCCGPQKVYTNSFIAMPSPRVRALGYQIYKYNIKGFLHWGLNFYNSEISRYNINPYLTTSADGAFPSGDGFILYPSKNGAYGCIRGEVTYQAIQDIDVCFALEGIIGREAVIKMIDDAADGELTLEKYPSDAAFYETLREKMVKIIAENTK